MDLSTFISSVVFVGHSLFGPDNPQMLEQLLAHAPAAQQKNVQVQAQIINGAPLSYNWEHAAEAEGINARTALTTGVDAVIVTEAIPLDNHLKWSGTAEAIAQFYDVAKTGNPDVTFYVQETWHSLKSGSGEVIRFDDGMGTPWRERLEQDLPKWQAAVDKARDLTGGDIQLLQAGQALARLDDAIRAGTVPGVRAIDDFFTDDIHPNALGFYFISLFQYAVMTGQNPKNLPIDLVDRWGKSYAAPTPELARRLQIIAERAARGESQHTVLPKGPGPLPQDPQAVALNTSVSAPVPTVAAADYRQPIAMNLAAIADWSPQAPFLDHFKTTRPWIGHIAGRWGGINEAELRAAGYLDPDGWPTSIPPELGSIGTVVLTDQPETARSLAGRYRLQFQGDGIIEVGGRAQNVRYRPGEIWFDFTPGPGFVDIRIQRTDRAGTGDYVRNVTVVKQEHIDAFAAGDVFNPRWLDILNGFSVLRFMDWMHTNDSTQIGWEDRPLATDYTWARTGVPAEILIRLANELGTHPWFSMPHMSDDSYMRNFARMTHQLLNPDLTAYVEFSNEVWNWQFQQAQWAEHQAQARWGGKDLWMQFNGGRAAEMAQIWDKVFNNEADARLIKVIATQTGWLGLEQDVLTAPLWTAEKGNRRAPHSYFDAYAITGYFGGVLGLPEQSDVVRAWLADSRTHAETLGRSKDLTGAALREFVKAHQFDVATAQAHAELSDGLISGEEADTLADFLTRILPYHADIARRHDLDLIMYEGGSHVVGVGANVDDPDLTAFFTHFNYTPEMGTLYQDLLRGWKTAGGKLFTAYADVYAPSKWGSWGALRSLTDSNPRWSALEAAK